MKAFLIASLVAFSSAAAQPRVGAEEAEGVRGDEGADEPIRALGAGEIHALDALDADVLSIENDKVDGEPLLRLVMQGGRRVSDAAKLADSRVRAQRELARLPEPLRRLEPGAAYPVEVTEKLQRLAAEVDRRLGL